MKTGPSGYRAVVPTFFCNDYLCIEKSTRRIKQECLTTGKAESV
jgi:hypothetical protein